MDGGYIQPSVVAAILNESACDLAQNSVKNIQQVFGDTSLRYVGEDFALGLASMLKGDRSALILPAHHIWLDS